MAYLTVFLDEIHFYSFLFLYVKKKKKKAGESMSVLEHAAAAKSLQSCQTLCDPIDGSP